MAESRKQQEHTRRIGVWIAATLAALLSAATAWAQPGTIVFRNGTRLEGDILSNQPGQPVQIRTPDGTLAAYRAEDVASVEFAAPTAPSGPPPAPPPGPPPAFVAPAPQAPTYDPVVQQLIQEKQALRHQRGVGIGGPIAFMAAGAGILGVGGGVYAVGANQCVYYYDIDGGGYDQCGEWNGTMTAGVIMMSIGGALLITGVALLPGRLARRAKRNRRLREVDQELALRGIHASLSPLVPLREGQPYGLTLRATF